MKRTAKDVMSRPNEGGRAFYINPEVTTDGQNDDTTRDGIIYRRRKG